MSGSVRAANAYQVFARGEDLVDGDVVDLRVLRRAAGAVATHHDACAVGNSYDTGHHFLHFRLAKRIIPRPLEEVSQILSQAATKKSFCACRMQSGNGGTQGLLSEDSYARLLKGLKRLVQLERTLSEMGVELEKNERFLYQLFSGRGQISAQLLMRLAELLKLTLRGLAEAIGPSPIDKPETILLLQRERKVLPANPFLDPLTPRFEALLALPAKEEVALSSAPPQLADLEELRFADRAAAQSKAEAQILELLATLEEAGAPQSGRALGQLAATLALWATIQRGKGLRDLAIKAFAQAFPLARHSGDSWALGNCYQRAAFVLRDLDRADIGHNFINEAFGHYGAAMAMVDIWKCLAERGSMYATLGMLEESDAAFSAALRQLPGAEWRHRVAGLQGLGANARRKKQPEQARSFLVSAALECRQEDLLLGHVKWSRAAAEYFLGREEDSLRLFRESSELLSRFGSAGDLALVSVDHAEVLLKLGRINQLILLLTDVLSWLPKLDANPLLLRALRKMQDFARASRLGMKELEGTRKDIGEALKRGEVIEKR